MDENLNKENETIVTEKNVVSGKIDNPPEQEERSGISLGQIWFMLKKHFVALIIMAFVGLAAGVLYDRVIKKPSYTCSTQIMIVNTDTEESESSQNISDARSKCLIAYGYMTSDEVATALGKKLAEDKYDYSIKDANGNATSDYDLVAIQKLYSVTIPTVTSNTTSIFLTVTATASSKDLAIEVANKVPEVGIELCNTKGTYGYAYLKNSMACLAEVKTATDSSTSTLVIALVGVLGGVVVGAAYAIIRELVNTKVSSRYDLEMLTGYKVIGMIPKYDAYVLDEDQKGEAKDAE